MFEGWTIDGRLYTDMIIRSLPLRHGRYALPRSCSLSRPWRRYVSHETESHAVASESTLALPRNSLLKPEDIRDPNHPVAQEYLFMQHQRALTNDIGSTITPHYRPHELLSNPPRPGDITLELLMASQAHIGHATSLWHPANAKYIYGVRGDVDPIHIIALDVTAAHLRRACKIVRGVAERGGLVLFVGTRANQARCVVRAARLAQGCHLFEKWTPGSITNGQQILGACRKKVVDELDREVLGFQDQLAYTSALKPDLVVCLNPLENYILLRECGIHNVPTIGIVDTDVNPTWVTYPIPANDDSLRCVQVIAGVLGRAGQEGQEARREQAENGSIPYMVDHGLRPPTKGQAEREIEAAERAARALKEEYEEGGQIVHEDLSAFEEEGETGRPSTTATDSDEWGAGANEFDELSAVDPSLLGNPPLDRK